MQDDGNEKAGRQAILPEPVGEDGLIPPKGTAGERGSGGTKKGAETSGDGRDGGRHDLAHGNNLETP